MLTIKLIYLYDHIITIDIFGVRLGSFRKKAENPTESETNPNALKGFTYGHMVVIIFAI